MDQLINLTTNVLGASAGAAAWTLKTGLSFVEKVPGSFSSSSKSGQVVLKETIHSLPPDMKRWIAAAGLMGATAVFMNAYGSHVVFPRKEIPDSRKAVYEAANKVHFLHSLALGLAGSNLSGSLFVAGTAISAGSCYYYALTGSRPTYLFSPLGYGTLLLAWLSLML